MERFSRLRLGWVAALVAALVVTAIAAIGAGVSRAGTSTPTAESTPAGANAYPRRLTICHRSGRLKRSRYRTVRIPPRSLRAHVRHGDGIGACSRARFTICHKVRKRGKVVRQRTTRVRGWRAHRKHMRHGDRIRACPRKKRR
jgi:hypothetical protein